MSVVAKFSIEAKEFLLGRIIADFPALTVEIERVVPAANRVMPYIWGYGDDLDAFVGAMRAHPNVKSTTVLDRLDDRALYKIEWEDPAEQLIAGIAEIDATILEAHSDDAWTFQIRFEDHSGLAAFSQYCAAHGIDYRLVRVAALADTIDAGGKYDLTERQHEALALAVQRGYFDIPRQVTFEELAVELGVSAQAVSERVRRGVRKVCHIAFDAPFLPND